MGQIIELPDLAQLKQDIAELKNRLEEVFFERDELRYVICPNLKTRYMLEIGSLEYRVYVAYCEFLRLRRKKELIQARKNRQETIEEEVLEELLDEEFLMYRQKLDEKMQDMNQALERSQMETLSEEETVAFKKMYRSIVKHVHPDLNPGTSEAEKDLFLHAIEAYKLGDFATLELIFHMVGEGPCEEVVTSSLTTLQKEKQRYQDLLDRVVADINDMKTKPPYIWKIYWEDESKKAKKIVALQRELKSFQQAIRTQAEYIHDLIGDEA